MSNAVRELEVRLDSYDAKERGAALSTLAGLIDEVCEPADDNGDVNMHCHSFFSYNADGWSPSRIAWECRKRGLLAAGLCDFDVLDGLEEFIEAGHLLGLRTAVHLETRAFFDAFASVDINSPGEPGVNYVMGTGFYRSFAEGTPQAETLAELRQGATQRNQELIARINAKIPQVALDYQRDVLPLTPRGVATERHIIRAYGVAGQRIFPDTNTRAAFWAPLLKLSTEAAAELERDTPKFDEALRGALAKRGGVGYKQPDTTTFPPIGKFTAWVNSCGAIPTATWLDGTSGGEADCARWLEALIDYGCAVVAFIPDRNWNLKNRQDREVKIAKMDELVRESVKRDMPLIIGTEMNKKGLPFADDLNGPVLSKYSELFRDGAKFIVGQTILGRYAAMPYLSERAAAAWPSASKRNEFYTKVGGLPPLDRADAEALQAAGPDKAFGMLADKIELSTGA